MSILRTVLVVAQSEHQVVAGFYILRAIEARFGWCIRESKARKAECNDVKTRVVRRGGREQRQEFLNLEEVPRP